MKPTTSQLKENTITQKQAPEMTGCARLYQLLSTPSQPNEHVIPDNGGTMVGSAGVNIIWNKQVKFSTHDQNTNWVIRALAACQAGLVVDSSSDGNTYVAGNGSDGDLTATSRSTFTGK